MIIKVILASFMLLCQTADGFYWEDLDTRAQNAIINSRLTPALVRDYYQADKSLSDDSNGFALLNELTSKPKSDDHLALYFYVFNTICMSADGAIAESLGHYCLRMVQDQPSYVLSYLENHSDLMARYASFIGYEFSMSEEYLDKYKSFEKKVLSSVKSDISNSFLHLIKLTIDQALQ